MLLSDDFVFTFSKSADPDEIMLDLIFVKVLIYGFPKYKGLLATDALWGKNGS